MTTPQQPQAQPGAQAPEPAAPTQAPAQAPTLDKPQQAPAPAQAPTQAAAPQMAPPQMPPQQAPQQMAQQMPPPAGPAVAGGGYASPIPMVTTHLGHAIASEWTKIRTVRSTMWTLGLMFLLVVGIGALAALGRSSEDSISMPLLSSGLFGLMLGQICIITLGVLVITSEYGTGMIRTTLTACPQRGRVLLAKALVFFLLAFVMTTAACTLTALIHQSVLGGTIEIGEYGSIDPEYVESVRNGEYVAQDGEWLGTTVGAGLYVSLLGLLSLSVGAILRHSAGAITTMLGVVLLPLLLALFMVGDSLETLREKLIEFSPLNGLASLFLIPMQSDQDASGWPLLGLLALVTAGALGAAYALLTSRDV